ncbi:MAG: type III-B CRISPR-associated protein Cas10/Cmr2 [Verrucomicrobiota bacterium]|nr:type III-B CRISPR-associated protein Cas10/Cmr2 [Verrucomicrobiota bacterium]
MTDWKSKLAAYLHDPPFKAFKIQGHEDYRKSLFLESGFNEEEFKLLFERVDDHWAAAADRFIFPDWKKSQLTSDWKEADFAIKHPLSGEVYKPLNPPSTEILAEEQLTIALKGCTIGDLPDTPEGWKKKYFRVWRQWPEIAAREKNGIHAYLPSDTRIPDHSIWQHNGLVSAFSNCQDGCAFLMLQIGPVQDFIKQARKMQDLWSGSYLLSFLIAQGMLAIADAVGPDAIIFPNLRGVPLADWHWNKQGLLPTQMRASFADELLIPGLPNRFLALVPKSRAEEMRTVAEKAIRDAWSEIAESVHEDIKGELGAQCVGWDAHWEFQTKRFPVIDAVVHDWDSFDHVIEQAKKGIPPLEGGFESHPLCQTIKWMEKLKTLGHMDSRCAKPNDALGWPLHYAITDWLFAATKNARNFNAWHGGTLDKDNLSGREEVMGGSTAEECQSFRDALRIAYGGDKGDFKGKQQYGAISIIKRLWPKLYLGGNLGWETCKPNFESIPEIAQIDKSINEEGDDADTYYAVIAMDGDGMGEWVSGSKTPELKDLLSKEAKVYFESHWKEGDKKFSRPLTPAYHAALSEALSNFGLYCAGQVVGAFKGQLFYAGGDDVLAIVPVQNAIACAQALVLAFQGKAPSGEEHQAATKVMYELFEYPASGFIKCIKHAGKKDDQRPNWPLMVMSEQATASVGVAIGHVHSPMQDVIQAAREAETAAKGVDGKGALCLKVMKRSGEAVKFKAKFDSKDEKIWNVWSVWEDLSTRSMSNRTVYKYLQLIKPLLACTVEKESEGGWMKHWNSNGCDESTVREILYNELVHVLSRDESKENRDNAKIARYWIDSLQAQLSPTSFIHFWMAWAFMKRQSTDGKTSNAEENE